MAVELNHEAYNTEVTTGQGIMSPLIEWVADLLAWFGVEKESADLWAPVIVYGIIALVAFSILTKLGVFSMIRGALRRAR